MFTFFKALLLLEVYVKNQQLDFVYLYVYYSQMISCIMQFDMIEYHFEK